MARTRVRIKSWDDLSEWCEEFEEKIMDKLDEISENSFDGEEAVGSALDHPIVKPLIGHVQQALATPGGLDTIIKGLVQRVKRALAEDVE